MDRLGWLLVALFLVLVLSVNLGAWVASMSSPRVGQIVIAGCGVTTVIVGVVGVVLIIVARCS